MLALHSHHRRFVCLSSLLLLTLGLGLPSLAQADGPKEGGIFVTVPNPLTGTAVESIKKYIDRARNQPNAKLTKVVFDFNPGETDSRNPLRNDVSAHPRSSLKRR